MSAPNWKNQTIWTGDNLHIMRGMNSESVDLIYLDPPFNSKHNYAAPIGSTAAGAEFKDTWGLNDINLAWHGLIKDEHPGLYALLQATQTIHSDSMMSYLIYMVPRVMEMKRILKATGSIYLHCDHHAGHYLKLVMDAVFHKGNFKNDITWFYGRGARGAKAIAKHFPRNNDNILYYAKKRSEHFHEGVFEDTRHPVDDLPSHVRHDENGYFKTAPRGDYTDASIARLRKENRIYETRSGNIRIRYPLASDGVHVIEPVKKGSVWEIPDMMHTPKNERTHHPTQKPLRLLSLIIEASSKKGDMVLDPFCGCATACIAAEKLQRGWVGIDISSKAAELVQIRLHDELGLYFKGTLRDDVPQRTDLGKIPRYNSIENRKKLYGEQGGYCNACEHHFELRHLEVDHIVPRNDGGTDHISNLQLLCGSCNKIKGPRPQEYLVKCLTDKGWIKRKKKEAR